MKKRQRNGVIQAYTDGAYNWETGIGGYGAVIFMNKDGVNRIKKLASTVSYIDTTNNRMEARAILAVLLRIKVGYDIDIYTDSKYCERVMGTLLRNFNYRPPANTDIWKKVADQVKNHKFGGSHINISWVRSHSGNTFNEIADKLAFQGSIREKKVICDQKFHEKRAMSQKSTRYST